MKKWYAIIGDPIEQSKSPFMQSAWFQELKMDATYIPHHIREENLQQAVESLKLLGCSGWNVTVPHKTAIIPYLDEIDETAKQMNAVNTVVTLPDGRIRGYNTDGPGFVQSLEEQFEKVAQSKKVLVIGAGGAARGICYSLKAAGYGPITIANRTTEKAQKLADELGDVTACSLEEAERHLGDYHLIVQTTSVGMHSSVAGLPIDLTNLGTNTIIADIIYNPLETEFIKEAKERGAEVMNGLGMFVHQGAIAFEKWTGKRPNTENMIETITQQLGGTYVNR